MKIILRIIYITILFVFLFLVISEIKYRKSSHAIYSKYTQLRSTNTKALKTLILGTSETFYNINPEFLNHSAYNVALPNQSLYINKLILETYIDSFPNLKQVVIGLSYSNFNSPTFSNQNSRLYAFYNYFMKLKDTNISKFNVKRNYMVFNMPLNKTLKLHKNQWNTISHYNNGFAKLETRSILKNKAVNFDMLQTQLVLKQLNAIAELCIQRNKLLYVVLLPDRIFDKTLEKQNIKTACFALENTYTNVNCVSFFDDAFIEKRHFLNKTHLNFEGAKICTKQLSELID